MPPLPLPAVVAHADWSVDPAKRWVAAAVRRGASYRAGAPEPVGDLATVLARLAARAEGPGVLLLGVDFPIGLPAAYAAAAGVAAFRGLLPELGRGRWRDFFEVAEWAEEVSTLRPFYPKASRRKGETSRDHLLEGLKLTRYSDLLRRCDRATASRPAAAALFWTLGAQQVGKAAIAGWRDFLIPALDAHPDLTIWPFDGPMAELLAAGGPVIAETYPGEIYRHLGLDLADPQTGRRGSKQSQAVRQAAAPVLSDRARDLGVVVDEDLAAAIDRGYGSAPGGDDPFDAVIGLFGMINVLRGRRPPGEPEDPVVRELEGWILGQSP